MSVQGPSSLPLRVYTPPVITATGAARGATAAAAHKPGQAPPESSLWELLTDEERGFFSQQASLGALTYGRGNAPSKASPAGAAPLGQRLDVKG